MEFIDELPPPSDTEDEVDEVDLQKQADDTDDSIPGLFRCILVMILLALVAPVVWWWLGDVIVKLLADTLEAAIVHGGVVVLVLVFQNNESLPRVIHRLFQKDIPVSVAVFSWISGLSLVSTAIILCFADMDVFIVIPIIGTGMLFGIFSLRPVRRLLGVSIVNLWYSASYVLPFIQMSALILAWSLKVSSWEGLLFLAPPGILVIIGRACLERYICSKQEARPRWYCTPNGEPISTTLQQAAAIDSLVPKSICTPDVRRIQFLATQAWFLSTMMFLSYHTELYMTEKNVHKTCAPVACTALILIIMSVPVWPVDVHHWVVCSLPFLTFCVALATGVANIGSVDKYVVQPVINILNNIAMEGISDLIRAGIFTGTLAALTPVLGLVVFLAFAGAALAYTFCGSEAGIEVFNFIWAVCMHPGTLSLFFGLILRSIGPRYHGYRLYNSWGSLISIPGFVYCVLYSYNRYKIVRDRLIVPWTSAEPIPEIKGGSGLSLCVASMVVLYYMVDIVRYVINLEGVYFRRVAGVHANKFDDGVPEYLVRDTSFLSNTIGTAKTVACSVWDVVCRDFIFATSQDVPVVNYEDPFEEESVNLTIKFMKESGVAAGCAVAAVCIPTIAAVLLNLMLNGSQLVLYIICGIICAAVVSNVRNVWFSVICVAAAVVVAVNLGPIGSDAPCFYRDQFTNNASDLTFSETIANAVYRAHFQGAGINVDDIDKNDLMAYSDQVADIISRNGTVVSIMTSALARSMMSRTPPKTWGEGWNNVVRKYYDILYPKERFTNNEPTVQNGMLAPHNFECKREVAGKHKLYFVDEIRDLPNTFKSALHATLEGFVDQTFTAKDAVDVARALVDSPSSWRQVLCDKIELSGVLSTIQTSVFRMRPPVEVEVPVSP